jgi:Fe2+ transport system protein FeoA
LRFSLNKTAIPASAEGHGPLHDNKLLPLELLGPGECADVAEVSGEPAWVNRLAEMGVQIGSRLRVVQPGSPCLLQIGGARLSLRPDWGTLILVRPVAEAG